MNGDIIILGYSDYTARFYIDIEILGEGKFVVVYKKKEELFCYYKPNYVGKPVLENLSYKKNIYAYKDIFLHVAHMTGLVLPVSGITKELALLLETFSC